MSRRYSLRFSLSGSAHELSPAPPRFPPRDFLKEKLTPSLHTNNQPKMLEQSFRFARTFLTSGTGPGDVIKCPPFISNRQNSKWPFRALQV